MNSKQLISHELPSLSYDDSGNKALRLMNEYRVFHLPLIQRDNYIALISEDDILDWDTPEQPLSLAEFLNFRPTVFEDTHPYEAIKIAKELNLSVIPVVNKHNHFSGAITIEGLFTYLTDNSAIKELGAILVLEMEQRNYSLSEIAKICESNDITILSTIVKTNDDKGTQLVILKINKNDIESLVATFERFKYSIIETFSSESTKQDVQENLDSLMRYLNL